LRRPVVFLVPKREVTLLIDLEPDVGHRISKMPEELIDWVLFE